MYDKIQPFLKVALLTACTAAAVSIAVMCIRVASVANNISQMTNPGQEDSCASHLNQALANISGATGKLSALVGSNNLLNEPENEPKDGNNKPHGTVESVVNEVSGAAKGLHNGIRKNGINLFSGISYAAEEPKKQESLGWFGWLRRN